MTNEILSTVYMNIRSGNGGCILKASAAILSITYVNNGSRDAHRRRILVLRRRVALRPARVAEAGVDGPSGSTQSASPLTEPRLDPATLHSLLTCLMCRGARLPSATEEMLRRGLSLVRMSMVRLCLIRLRELRLREALRLLSSRHIARHTASSAGLRRWQPLRHTPELLSNLAPTRGSGGANRGGQWWIPWE